MIWEAASSGPRIVSIKQRPLKKTIREWEDENNAIWPVLDGVIVPRPTDGSGIQKKSDLLESYRHVHVAERERVICRNDVSVALPKTYDDDGDWAPKYSDYRTGSLLGGKSGASSPDQFACREVCREAFEVVSRNYTTAFASHHSVAETCFDFMSDILYLRYDEIARETKTALFMLGADMQDVVTAIQGGFRLDTNTVRKVGRLALLLDPVDLLQDALCDTVAIILSRFSCLEKLILVVNRAIYQDHPKDISSSDFIDPVDVNRARSAWTCYDPEQERHVANVQLPLVPFLDGLPQLDMDDLKLQNRQAREAGKEWAIPHIEFKLLASKDTKEVVDNAKANCEARIREFLLCSKK